MITSMSITRDAYETGLWKGAVAEPHLNGGRLSFEWPRTMEFPSLVCRRVVSNDT